MREIDQDWPHVVAVSSTGEHRIIVSRDTPPAVQWILQRFSGGRWRPQKYCQSKVGLQIFATFDPALRAAVDLLPDWCPQIGSKRGQRRKSARTGVPEVSERDAVQAAKEATYAWQDGQVGGESYTPTCSTSEAALPPLNAHSARQP